MKNKNIGLFIQAILFVLVFIALVISTFIKEFMTVVEIILGLALIVTGINNKLFYKRKYMTLIYILFGILSIILTIYGVIVNGI